MLVWRRIDIEKKKPEQNSKVLLTLNLCIGLNWSIYCCIVTTLVNEKYLNNVKHESYQKDNTFIYNCKLINTFSFRLNEKKITIYLHKKVSVCIKYKMHEKLMSLEFSIHYIL